MSIQSDEITSAKFVQTLYHRTMTTATVITQAIIVNAGTTREATQVVKPLKDNGKGKTLVAYIDGARISTKWIKTERIITL